MRQVPPKRRFLQEPHGVTTQKTPFFKHSAAAAIASVLSCLSVTLQSSEFSKTASLKCAAS
jgi:hypothetical protein